MTAVLHVVTPDTGAKERGFKKTARALLNQVLADGAKTLVIFYEVPNDWKVASVPDSEALQRGAVGTLVTYFFPDTSESGA